MSKSNLEDGVADAIAATALISGRPGGTDGFSCRGYPANAKHSEKR